MRDVIINVTWDSLRGDESYEPSFLIENHINKGKGKRMKNTGDFYERDAAKFGKILSSFWHLV